MTQEEFYKMKHKDMYDYLRKLRIELKLFDISVMKLKDITDLFQCGYRVNNLIQYLCGINKKERIQNEYDEGIFKTKYERWLKEDPEWAKEIEEIKAQGERILAEDRKRAQIEQNISNEIEIKIENKEIINDMNLVIISGNLVRNPEGAVTSNGKSYSRFDLAVNERFNGVDNTTYVKVSCWDKTADFVNNYFKKGECVVVEGRLRTYEYTVAGQKRSGLEVVARSVERPNVSSKPKNTEETFDYSYNDAMKDIKEPTLPAEDDDVPF